MAEKAKDKAKKTGAVVPRRVSSELSPWGNVDRMFEDFLERRLRPFSPDRWWPTAGMEVPAPALDVYEEKDDIVVKAELPGMEKDNIEVNLSDNPERSYGSFVRSLELPSEVQTDKIKAAFKNGVLEIRLPKTEEAKKRETKVKID